MGLSPGWQSPDFELIEHARPTTFRQWRAGRWGIVATSTVEFTPASLRCAARHATLGYFHLITLDSPAVASHGDAPENERPLIDIPRTGTLIQHPEHGDLTTIADPEGNIRAQWSGIRLEVGPDEPPVTDCTAYILDPNGVIRLTYTFTPGSRHDIMTVVCALEKLIARRHHPARTILRAA